MAITPDPLSTFSMGAAGARGSEANDSLDPSVEMLSLDPVEPIDPRRPTTDKVFPELLARLGSSKGGRFPFQTKEANQEQ